MDIFSLFGSKAVPVLETQPLAIQSEVLAERPAQIETTLTRLSAAYEEALALSNGDKQAAAVAFMRSLQREVQGPILRGPRAKCARISDKQRRRLARELDRIIQADAA